MSLRVLVAEDEALIALSLADLLEAEGHDVHLAPDGLTALAAARSLGSDLDVLVTDLNMPGMTGEDLIRALSADWPSLPVVVVTGSAPPDGLEAVRRQSGGHRPLTLLHKPFASATLVSALRDAAAAAAGRRPERQAEPEP